MASVEERVKQIIVEQLGVDDAEVTPTASFVPGIGITPRAKTANPRARVSATSRITPSTTKPAIPRFWATAHTLPPATA